MAMMLSFFAAVLNEDALTTTTAVLLFADCIVQVCFGLEVFWLQRTDSISRKPLISLRWKVFVFGVVQYILIVSASLAAKPSTLHFLRLFPALLWNMVFCVTSADGIPLLVTLVAVQTGHSFTMFYRGLNTVTPLSLFFSYLPPLILPTSKAVLLYREYQQLLEASDRKRTAQVDQQLHESALRILLPPHIASHIARLEARGSVGPEAIVSDTLLDESVLLMRLPMFSRMSEAFDVLTAVQKILTAYSNISLIHTDGDELTICGPLLRPKQTAGVVSVTEQSRGLRLVSESAATESTIAVLNVLVDVARTVELLGVAEPLTVVLHRGDGLSVVFRSVRPVFAIEGIVMEVSRAILQTIEPGTLCLTKRFLELLPTEGLSILSSHFSAVGEALQQRASVAETVTTGNVCGEGSNSSSWPAAIVPDSSMRIRGVGYLTVFTCPCR
jgi:hypothetical protein